MIYKILIRPILFLLDPEMVHNFAINFFSRVTFLYPLFKIIYNPGVKKNNSFIELEGLKFKNRLGLAAGFDKNGKAIRFWDALGFSHIEVGTVTPLPQPGNPKPRIFRLKKDEAIINRLGFNNNGADDLRLNIEKAKKYTGKDFIIGVNIGKNKDTPIKDAVSDYKICMEKLYDVADYFTVNISSPNTEGLRKLHEEEYLDELLFEISALNKLLSQKNSYELKHIFLKIAPDLSPDMIEMIYELVIKNKLSGIIATNTTVERIDLKSDVNEQGGLSGKPLKEMSDKVLRKLSDIINSNTKEPLILIGVGGVFNKEDYQNKFDNGASLVQIYTGLIYNGPGILKNLIK